MAEHCCAKTCDDVIAYSSLQGCLDSRSSQCAPAVWFESSRSQSRRVFRRLLRRTHSLVAELWIAGRWLVLKICVQFLYAVLRKTERAERLAIRLGNLLFKPMYPVAFYADYNAYVRHMPADLRTYLDLWDPRQWLIGKVVLDLGAGLGQYSDQLRREGASNVVGLEYQQEKIRHWMSRGPQPGCGAMAASAMEMPFAAASFDTVFSHTVFEHLGDVGAALREIRRVLKPGGYALLSVNYFHHRGGHHLFPYIHFPWAPWIASEEALCSHWSQQLAKDQARGLMGFYSPGCQLRTLTDGAEIQLNKLTFDDFEPLVQQAGLRIEKRCSSETLSYLPILASLPQLKYFLNGTIYYVLAAPLQEAAQDKFGMLQKHSRP